VRGLLPGGSFRLRDAPALPRDSSSRPVLRRSDRRAGPPPFRPSVWLLASLPLSPSSASQLSSSLVHCSSYKSEHSGSTTTPRTPRSLTDY